MSAAIALPDGLPERERGGLAELLEALDGIPVTDEERRILVWLAGWEADTVRAVANMVRRARRRAAERGAWLGVLAVADAALDLAEGR